MKKVTFVATLPVWVGYLLFSIGWYVFYEDDLHIAALNDIVMWFFE